MSRLLTLFKGKTAASGGGGGSTTGFNFSISGNSGLAAGAM